jgi:hypothetical protein
VKDRYTANTQIFSEIDDGTTVLISIDIEGSEWFVIKPMVSRPAIISVETHGGIYTNPFLHELETWMQSNSYTLLYKTRSDSVFVLSNIIQIGLDDKIQLYVSNISIKFKSLQKENQNIPILHNTSCIKL